MQRIGGRILLDTLLRSIDGGDDGSRGSEGTIGKLELWIDRSQVTGRPHVDGVRPQDKQRAGTLGPIRDDHGKLSTARLRLPDQAERRLSVTARRSKKHMQVLLGVCIEEGLLE